jgi:hypothetical protein
MVEDIDNELTKSEAIEVRNANYIRKNFPEKPESITEEQMIDFTKVVRALICIRSGSKDGVS